MAALADIVVLAETASVGAEAVIGAESAKGRLQGVGVIVAEAKGACLRLAGVTHVLFLAL